MRTDTSSWRAPAFSAYAYLRAELKRLRSVSKANLEGAASVERALDEALLAMTPARDLQCECDRTAKPHGKRRRGLRWPRPWLRLKRFYSGSNIEQAWRAIHRAQAALYTIYREDELLPQAEHVEAVVAELPEQTSLMKLVSNLIHQISTPRASTAPLPTADPRTMLRGFYERAVDVSDNLQREARGLRNALLIASLASLLVLLAVGVAHMFDRTIVDLCTTTHTAGKTAFKCPLGGKPHPFDVFAIELAGMLGGLLSVIVPLATGEQIKTPYRVFNQQLLLKLLAGAATAVGGVLLIESGVITGIKLATIPAIFGYAIFFGFSQQVATGAIDRRADALAKQTPIAKTV